jgi:hypothetical protein
LPKICGNIASAHATVAAALTLFSGCTSAAPTTVAIAAHYVPACAPPAASAARELELVALGDFDRSNDSVAILQSDSALRSVTLPAGTRAAELETLGDGAYWGSGTLAPDSQLSILLWPRDRACSLARFDGVPGAPDDGGDASWLLGASARLRALLVTGPGVETSSEETTYVELASGAGSSLGAERGPHRARRTATLSELGDGLVLAGGVDVASGRVLGDAERFDPALGRFTGESIALALPRARHAALGLSPGRSLLIGGESASGQALRSVELLSTDSPRGVLELLATPRVAPQAVLLGQNRVLVGGGYVTGPGGERQPIETVEWLSTDLTDVGHSPISLSPAALDRAFVAFGSGAALAVGGCEAEAGVADCIPCRGGCVSRAVWWIDPRGTPHLLTPLPAALAVPDPRLVPGAGGRPWLIARGRLGHFDPWLGRFELVDAGRPAALDLPLLGQPLALGPGLFAWLEASASGTELLGFYHSQRGPYTQDVAPLLVGSADGIVPHQPPTSDNDPSRLAYSPARGLELSGSAAVVSVADTEYAAFTLELSLASGPPPLLQLVAANGEDGDAAFGGFECPWPALDASPDGGADARAPVRLRVERAMDQVRLERLEGSVAAEPRPEPCGRALPERVGIQLVGTPAGITRLTRIEIHRSSD